MATAGCASRVAPADGGLADVVAIGPDAPGAVDIASLQVDVTAPPEDVSADTATPQTEAGCFTCDCCICRGRGRPADAGPRLQPFCEDIGRDCCWIFGPLAPPELPA